jgi:MOSC domain-containing protein YiiM
VKKLAAGCGDEIFGGVAVRRLEGTGPCTPCSRMDKNLGAGGRLAMKGLGGLTALVIEAGRIRRGDPVTPLM